MIDLCDIERESLGQDATVGRYGDSNPPASAKYMVRTGMATSIIFGVMRDGAKVFEVAEASATAARKTLRESWSGNETEPWPGHQALRLEYIEVW